jgi:hypothetical protein
MTDLMDRLHRLGEDTPTLVPDEIVRRDVARARGALLRTRVRRGVAGLSVAAVAVVGTAIVVGNPADNSGGPQIAQPSGTGGSDVVGSDLGLVAYTGVQQPGFVVSKVPEGFVLQGATPFSLDVARADDHSDLSVFVDKLVVMLESRDAGEPTGTPVKVGRYDGWIRTSDGAQTLTYDADDRRIVVQAWTSLGLSDAQVIEFAEGVTVTAEAQQSVG